MVSEGFILKLVRLDKHLFGSLLGKRFNVRPTTVFSVGLLLASTYFLLSASVDFLRNIIPSKTVGPVLWIVTLAMILTRLYQTIFVKGNFEEIYDQIIKVDHEIDNKTEQLDKQMDKVIICLLGLMSWTVVTNATLFVFISKDIFYGKILSYSSIVFVTLLEVKTILLKHLVAKRLELVRSSVDVLGLSKTISCTRQLLVCNDVINKSCQLNVFLLSLVVLIQMMHVFFVYWLIYGMGQAVPDAFENHTVTTILANAGIYATVILVAIFSSTVKDEIEEIKMKLDMGNVMKPSSIQAQTLVSLFLLELHHAKVLLSAFGLFDVSRPTVIGVVGTIISYELVLIQFS